MEQFLQRFRSYIETHPPDTGDEEHPTVLDQLYQAYAESHESDPPQIRDGFKELENFLCSLPLDNNNAVFNLCSAYEEKVRTPQGESLPRRNSVWGESDE